MLKGFSSYSYLSCFDLYVTALFRFAMNSLSVLKSVSPFHFSTGGNFDTWISEFNCICDNIGGQFN